MIDSKKPSGWLPRIIRKAEKESWCTKPVCTTCGAMVFREAIASQAYVNAGGTDNPNWNELSPAKSEMIVKEIVNELAGMDALFRQENGESYSQRSDAYRRIFMYLDFLHHRSKAIFSLDDALQGTGAGSYLSGMRRAAKAYEQWRSAEAEERRQKREVREKRRAAHKEMEKMRLENPPKPQMERISESGGEIQTFIKKFMKLSETKRLEEIADEAFGFPLDVIPRAYIPVNGDCSVLSRETRNRLIERIGRRKVRWPVLKKKLSGFEDEKNAG